MVEKLHLPFTEIRVGRFSVLLIAMILLLVLRPFLKGFIGVTLLMDISFTVVLLSGAYAVSQRKTALIIAIVLVSPAIIAHWIDYVVPVPFTDLGKLLFETPFFAFITITIFLYLFRAEEVTFDVIVASICVYFLIGLVWAFIYTILEILQPGSFQMSVDQLTEGRNVTVFEFAYFSYVTLTTLGYGDITPFSSPARSLSLLESIMGQLYIAILIARLVGIHISQSMRKK